MWNLVVQSTITMTKPPAAYDKFPPGHLNSTLDTWFKPYHDDKCFNKTRNMPWAHLINHTDPEYLHRFLCISLITPRNFNEGQSDCLLALANCEQWVCPGYNKHILSCMGDTYYSSPPSAAYMRKWNGSALVQIRLVAFSAPSNYQNQCWVIVNWTRRDKLQWNFSQITIFFKKMHLKIPYAKWLTFCPGGDELMKTMSFARLVPVLCHLVRQKLLSRLHEANWNAEPVSPVVFMGTNTSTLNFE